MPAMTTEWTITYTHEFPDGKTLEVGQEFRLLREKGKRYSYLRTVTTSDGETWIDCFGGAYSKPKSRSIHPELVNTAEIRKPKVRAK